MIVSAADHEHAQETWRITSEIPGPVRTLRDVWTYRRLLRFLAVRTLQKIYRRTVLGWLWLFIIPLLPIALRTFVFGGLLGVSSDGIPYFLFLTAGTVVWDLFASNLTGGTRGLELHGDIQDVYVPRVIMPIASTARAWLDLVIKLGVLVLAAAFFSFHDGRAYIVIAPSLFWAAAALLLAALFGLAVALFTSVWSEQTRDARYALGQLLAIWYLVTPVLYPMSSVPESWRTWLLLNPMAAIAHTFKYGLFRLGEPRLQEFGIAALTVTVVLVTGIRYFARHDAATIDAR